MFHTDLYNCTKKPCDSLVPGQEREVLYSSLPVCACVTAISPLFFPWRKPIQLEASTRSIRSGTVRHTASSARPEGRHGSGSAASLVVVGAGRSALALVEPMPPCCTAHAVPGATFYRSIADVKLHAGLQLQPTKQEDTPAATGGERARGECRHGRVAAEQMRLSGSIDPRRPPCHLPRYSAGSMDDGPMPIERCGAVLC